MAGEMTLSNLDYLAREGYVAQERDIKALKRIAVIGALLMAGLPLVLSARVANLIVLEFNQADGEVPSGLDQMYRILPDIALKTLRERPGELNDYWLHKALRLCPDIYTPGRAYSPDALIEIVDREFVFLSQVSSPISLIRNYEAERRLPNMTSVVGLIEGWKRNTQPRVSYFLDNLPSFDFPDHDQEANRLINKFVDARENAVGFTVVNISLAVRRSLDAITEHRAARLKNRRGKK